MNILHHEDYKKYLEKYTKIITHHLLYEDKEISLSTLKKDFNLNQKLEWENLQWCNYFEEVQPKINADDFENIEKLTRAFSNYLPYAINNCTSPKYFKYKTFISELFLKECYINAIIFYTTKYSEEFNDIDLLIITLKFFNKENFDEICLHYFNNLG